jgi:hypothetical protein
MSLPKSLPLKILLFGGIAALLVVVYGLTVANPPQCPTNYQPGPGDSCIIGANIGLGLTMMLSIFVWAVTLVSAFIAYVIQLRRQKITGRKMALRIVGIVLAGLLALRASTFLVGFLVDQFVRV